MECANKTIQLKSIKVSITEEEKKDLEYLFNQLLFDDFGIYVLFGSKPISCTPILDEVLAEEIFRKEWEKLSEEEKKQWEKFFDEERARGTLIEKLERNPYQCWQTFQKIREQLKITKYAFLIRPPSDIRSGNYELILIDLQKTTLAIVENYEIFRKAVGKDFNPLEVILEIENPESPFWKEVLSPKHHAAQGILFGFGRKNALFFEWEEQMDPEQRKKIEPLTAPIFFPSTQRTLSLGEASPKRFTIPIFGTFKDDKMFKTYQKEKKEIEKIYKNRDVVELTLNKLIEN